MKLVLLFAFFLSVTSFRLFGVQEDEDYSDDFKPFLKRSIRLPSAVQRKLYPSVVSASVPKRPSKSVPVAPLRMYPPVSDEFRSAIDCLGSKIFAKMRSWGDKSTINC